MEGARKQLVSKMVIPMMGKKSARVDLRNYESARCLAQGWLTLTCGSCQRLSNFYVTWLVRPEVTLSNCVDMPYITVS